MPLLALIAFLVPLHVSATPIVPNWDLLTDFTATYESEAGNVIALEKNMNPWRKPVISAASETGTIKVDAFGERFSVQGSGHLKFTSSAHGPLQGASVDYSGALAFDAQKGFIEFNGEFSPQGVMGRLNFRSQYCVKVNFPVGLLPPPATIKAMVQQKEGLIETNLQSVPHTEVTIDGENVAIVENPHPRRGHNFYIGIRHSGAPFGFGVFPPTHGSWHPLLKFPTWTHGAGDIPETTCSPSASTSLADLMADERAVQQLQRFDQLLTELQNTSSLNHLLAHFPARPSKIFESAATMEMIAATHRADSGSPLWAVAAIAGVATACGSFAVLWASRAFTKSGAFPKNEPLLQ